jgi:DNA helicase-2/ATP-dependent DNA helicase PcrA
VEYEKEEDFEEDRDKLEGYLERATLDTGTGGEDESVDSIALMTMHSAKGLEYKAVFIAGMEDGIFPGMRSAMEQDKLEEERRLCYVGITRAKNELYFLNAKSRMLYGKTTYNEPSQFIREIPEDLLERTDAKPAVKAQQPGKPSIVRTSFSAPAAAPAGRKVPEEPAERIAWKSGDTVDHFKFGRGRITEAVREAGDYKLTIEFETSGMKRIMASFAHLKKIN